MQSLYALPLALLSVISSNSVAAEIDHRLGCTVQEFTNVSVGTNATDGVTVEKTPPSKPIKVKYALDLRNGKLVETYAADSNLEQVTFYSRGYSAGGTQYIAEDGRSVVTYFGINGKYHVVVKFTRMQRNDGGPKTGFRADSYMNAFMYCIPIE